MRLQGVGTCIGVCHVCSSGKIRLPPTYSLKHASACRSTANFSWGPLVPAPDRNPAPPATTTATLYPPPPHSLSVRPQLRRPLLRSQESPHLAWATSFFGLVDLSAIAPFYIDLLTPGDIFPTTFVRCVGRVHTFGRSVGRSFGVDAPAGTCRSVRCTFRGNHPPPSVPLATHPMCVRRRNMRCRMFNPL